MCYKPYSFLYTVLLFDNATFSELEHDKINDETQFVTPHFIIFLVSDP